MFNVFAVIVVVVVLYVALSLSLSGLVCCFDMHPSTSGPGYVLASVLFVQFVAILKYR